MREEKDHASERRATKDQATKDQATKDSKAEMRARMRGTLGAMEQSRFIEGGAAISRRVLEMDEVRRVAESRRVVLAFVPMRRDGRLMEAEITGLLDGVIGMGAKLALPRGTSEGGMEACEVGEDWRGEVVASALKGVMEPGPSARRVGADEIGVVIVPGLAFDAAGGRLGRGKGFYDRFLGEIVGSVMPPSDSQAAGGSRRSALLNESARSGGVPKAPYLIGVCLEEQVVGCVPREEHDVLVDCVATDVRTMRVGPSRE